MSTPHQQPSSGGTPDPRSDFDRFRDLTRQLLKTPAPHEPKPAKPPKQKQK